jgi:hypothetical protein
MYSKWEGVIKKHTKLLLNLLQIENRDGIVPIARVDVAVRGMDADGLFGLRKGNGEIGLADVVINSQEKNGKKKRRGFFVCAESAKTFTGRGQKRGDQVTELPVPEQIVFDATSSLQIPFAFSIEIRKVVAKIALTAIAHQYGIPFALSRQFDDLRRSREADRATDQPVRIFANKVFMNSHAQTAQQHSIMCHMSSKTKQGTALVTLFGGLTYALKITSTYEECESRKFSIFYDAAAKKLLHPVVSGDELAMVAQVVSPDTVFEDKDAVEDQWFPIIASYCRQKGIDIEKVDPKNG